MKRISLFFSLIFIASVIFFYGFGADGFNIRQAVACYYMAVTEPTDSPGPYYKPTTCFALVGSNINPPQSVLDIVATAATNLDNLSNVGFSTSADCPPHQARENMDDMEAKLYPYVCSPTCGCLRGGSTGNVTVKASLLNCLTSVFGTDYSSTNFTVTSFTTGKHGAGSSHYQGRAADFVPDAGAATWRVVRDRMNSSCGGTAFCETTSGTNDTTCTTADHIHWTAP